MSDSLKRKRGNKKTDMSDSLKRKRGNEKTAVFGVGKFQAPHVGHRLMVDDIVQYAHESVNGTPFYLQPKRIIS
jgi:hypothetical protein